MKSWGIRSNPRSCAHGRWLAKSHQIARDAVANGLSSAVCRSARRRSHRRSSGKISQRLRRNIERCADRSDQFPESLASRHWHLRAGTSRPFLERGRLGGLELQMGHRAYRHVPGGTLPAFPRHQLPLASSTFALRIEWRRRHDGLAPRTQIEVAPFQMPSTARLVPNLPKPRLRPRYRQWSQLAGSRDVRLH